MTSYEYLLLITTEHGRKLRIKKRREKIEKIKGKLNERR